MLMALFIVCADINPRDQCETRRASNSNDKTADDCAMLLLIANTASVTSKSNSPKTPEQLESIRVFREQLNSWIWTQCYQSSIEAEKCRKIKPGFSNR